MRVAIDNKIVKENENEQNEPRKTRYFQLKNAELYVYTVARS